eukprot:g2692.t1
MRVLCGRGVFLGILLVLGTFCDAKVQQCAEERAPSTRGIAAYLITWHEDDFFSYYSDLLTSLRCLYKFVLEPYNYPVVIFVQGDMPLNKVEQIREQVPHHFRSRVIIKHISFDFPRKIRNGDGGVDGFMRKNCIRKSDGVNVWLDERPRRCGCGCGGDAACWHINYLHMNRFFTYKQWQLWRNDPDLKKYEYYMRVDVDLFLQRKVPHDPIQRAASRRCAFSTGQMQYESAGCFEGQLDATKAWVAQNDGQFVDKNTDETDENVNVTPLFATNLDKLQPSAAYWGAFNVGNITLFKSAAHLAYADHINEDGRMYTMRWNDQVHFAQATAMLTENNSVCFDDTFVWNGHSHDPLFVHLHGAGTDSDVMKKCKL